MLGANGAGKTTTLKTLSGLLRPRSGAIELQDGKRSAPWRPMRSSAAASPMCPRGEKFFPALRCWKISRSAATRAAKGALGAEFDFVFQMFPRLKERQKQYAGTLSGGEQQMLAIGRALMAKPKLLLLDEPSMGLAPKIVEQILENIREINKAGVTVLLVEQNAAMALAISHRGYVLETGAVILEGTASELAGNDLVRQAYLGG